MEVFDSRYFAINKWMLRSVGLWPFEHVYSKYSRRLLLAVAIIGIGLPHIVGMMVNRDKEKRVLLEHIGAIMLISALSVKIVASVVYEDKLRILYQAIASNWTATVEPGETQILEAYSERGRIITLVWMAYLVCATMSFVTLPLAPMLLDVLKPLEASRERQFILNGEFLVDRDANYGKIYAYDLVASMAIGFMFAVWDSMYAVCVEHCLALFAIISLKFRENGVTELWNVFRWNYGQLYAALSLLEFCSYRLQRPVALDAPDVDAAYQQMIQVIRLHTRVLHFSLVVESTYRRPFFAIIAVNLMYTSHLCVMMLLQNDSMLDLARYTLLCFGASIHLFYISWPGQKLIDHSSDLHRQAYLNQWYETSTRAKILLNFFMQRCSKPCVLTAGGLYSMNFENFVLIMKKSVSFMAVFSSFR